MKRAVFSILLLASPMIAFGQVSQQPTPEQQLHVIDVQYQAFQRASYQAALEQQLRCDAQIKALDSKIKELQKPTSDKTPPTEKRE